MQSVGTKGVSVLPEKHKQGSKLETYWVQDMGEDCSQQKMTLGESMTNFKEVSVQMHHMTGSPQ